jgi:site-specific DNA-methyltransferase (adenine-specific)
MCEVLLMEFHKICNIFPMMSEEEYLQLVLDIKAHGLREPIWTYQGKIIDGRNRYRACIELGIEPRYREWDGQGSLVQFVVSLNLHRRHLTSSQKAAIALEIEKYLAKEAEEQKRVAAARRQQRIRELESALTDSSLPVTQQLVMLAELQRLKGEPRREARREAPDVYFIRSGKRVKIGASIDPDDRLRQVRSVNPDAELLAVVPGGFQLERELQKKYAHLLVEGEWFELTDELAKEIMALSGVANSCNSTPQMHAAITAAKIVGTNHAYVSDAKRLAKELPEVLEKVRQGELTIPEAKKIVALPDDMRDIALEKLNRGEAKTVKEARKLAYQEIRSRAPQAPMESDAYRLICGDLATVETQIADESVDAIITDPPYSEEYLDTFEVLARVAARVLKHGSSLLTLAPHQWLPQILERMTKHLQYHWTLAYVQPGETARIWGSRIIVGWKPVLWFTKGTYAGDFVYDVVESDRRDKEHHEWGQSEGGIAALLERFTLPGQLVLDPFVGGGTTAVVAVRLGRRFIGVDIASKAIEETRRRLAELSKL